MDYDETSPKSIEEYGKKMIGQTFRTIYDEAVSKGILREAREDYVTSHADKKYKGGMGNLVEECWFGYAANSASEADFERAGVELKVTPYKQTKKGYAAKERLVLTMINYMEVVDELSFEASHLWKKARLMLLVWYLHVTGINDIKSTVDFVQLFTPPEEDMEIIREDYDKILTKIRAGKAHELSEGDTFYLGACTKAATSKDRRRQPFSDEPAKPRAFSFKNSYMTYVLTHYIMPGKRTYEPILGHDKIMTDFERYVTGKIEAYRNFSVDELCEQFDVARRPKNLESMLAFRIFGIKGNQAEEFEKAGIVVKSIRIGKNGKIKENMSFPAFRFDEIVHEEWEDSTFGNYLRETRFFLVIYHMDSSGELRLVGSQFWNMPRKDIENDVREVWIKTRDILRDGKLTLTVNEHGFATNNLPKQTENRVSHVRPHGQTKKDTYPLLKGTRLTIVSDQPYDWSDDTQYTKQCFWLNNSYILSQLEARFKKE